jgi:Zn-dependent protease with chaperone function
VRGWVAELALILLAGGVFASATAAALSLSWPLLLRALRRLAPAPRASAALGLACAPAALPCALVALCLAPGVTMLLGGHADHCLAHHQHAHLCLVHPISALTAPLAAVLAISGVALLVAGARSRVAVRGAWRRLAALESAATGALAPGVALVRHARPFSIAAGLWRPRIWISTALADALSSEQLEVVIEHERAHVRRRDALTRLVASACAIPLWPSVRHALLSELALAQEQTCDEVAGRRTGDRLRVADAILAVERLSGAASPAEPLGLLAFGGSTVPERVHSLLGEPPATVSPRHAALAAAGIAVGAVLGADPLHHATEHVLGVLVHLF